MRWLGDRTVVRPFSVTKCGGSEGEPLPVSQARFGGISSCPLRAANPGPECFWSIVDCNDG